MAAVFSLLSAARLSERRVQDSVHSYLLCTLQPDCRDHGWQPIREIVPAMHTLQAGIIPVGLEDMGDGY